MVENMKMIDLVKDKKVKFEYFRDGNFFYSCDNGFIFPVPVDDIGQATLLKEDKALFFMRWIRKHMAVIKNGNVVEETVES